MYADIQTTLRHYANLPNGARRMYNMALSVFRAETPCIGCLSEACECARGRARDVMRIAQIQEGFAV